MNHINVPSMTHAGCQVALYIERVECVRVRLVLVSFLHRDQSIMKAGRRTKTFAELCANSAVCTQLCKCYKCILKYIWLLFFLPFIHA